jgi:hypothetical protein
MLLLIEIISLFMFGWLLANLLINKMNLPLKLGASFLLGIGLYTLLLFILSGFGLNINRQNIFLTLWILILGTYLLVKLFRIDFSFKLSFRGFSIRRMGKDERISWALIILGFVSSLVFSTYWPVNEWDALALYDFRAKIITQTGEFIKIAHDYYYFTQYPLFTSLSHTIVYLADGQNPQFIYSFIFISFILIFYGTLREFCQRRIAIYATLAAVTTPLLFFHSTFAYTNLPYTTYLIGGFFFLFIYIFKGKIGNLIISALLISLSRWVRFAEPFWLVGLIVIAGYAINRKKIFFPILYYLILQGLQKPWKDFENQFRGTVNSSLPQQISKNTNSFLANINIEQLQQVADYLFKQVIVFWRPLFYIFVIVIILAMRDIRKRKSTVFLIIIILNFGLFFLGTYLFSLSHTNWNEIPDSVRRVAMIFLPMMLFYSTLAFDEISRANTKGGK